MKKNIFFLVLCCLTTTANLKAQTDYSDYFTAVIVGDPHIAQSGGTSVENMQLYVQNIVNLGHDNGLKFQFSTLPGYTPTADIVFCLGDMDGDSEKSGKNFKDAFDGLNAAEIPFITMVGNHDIVPDYWTGTNPDKGLTYGIKDGGSYCNDVALGIVTDQLNTAKSHGVENVTRFTDGTDHTQMQPFTFTFKGVRFYVGQTYWFQKPYTKPSIFTSATYYAPDGVIEALETFVDSHGTEPSVWMQHYPLIAGSDNDRWWLAQNDTGLSIAPSNSTLYSTAKEKRDKLTEIIKKSNNPVHFSGHTHWYAVNVYNGVKDYTVNSTFNENCAAYLVLLSKTRGVVEVKKVNLWPHNTYSHCDTSEEVPSMLIDIDEAMGHVVEEGEDVSELLGPNLDFETPQSSGNATFPNIHTHPGWLNIFSADANDTNKNYIFNTQLTGQNSGASTTTSLRLRAKWQENTIRQQVCKEVPLPPGSYTLSYHIKASQQNWEEDLNYYEIEGNRTLLEKTTEWSRQETDIDVIQPSVLKLSFGFIGGNGGNDCEVYVDDIHLTYKGKAFAGMRNLLHEEMGIAEALGVNTTETQDLLEGDITSEKVLTDEIHRLRTAEYDALQNNAYETYLDMNDVDNWAQTGGTATTSGQHWDGTSTSSYMEQSGANWGSNAWTIAYSRSLTLPAGRYVLKVACRSERKVTATISANGKSTSVPANGDTGYGITISGETRYSNDGIYANNGAGRGWEWRYVPFTLKKESQVNFSLDATTSTIKQWVSFTNISLLKKPFLRGDANDDGIVSVVDVTTMVNQLLRFPTHPFVFEAADLNDDNELTVTDITTVVDIILGKN